MNKNYVDKEFVAVSFFRTGVEFIPYHCKKGVNYFLQSYAPMHSPFEVLVFALGCSGASL